MSNRPTNVRVEYSIESTINTGNFQNVKPGYKISADVPPDTNPSNTRAKLKEIANAWLIEDINQHQAEMNG